MFRRAAAVALFSAVLGVGGFAASAAITTAPPGATALCNDGSYSFSKTHSGTCSHHGGVAKWLDGSGSSTGGIALGRIVLLGARDQTSHCVLGVAPERACSPGAIYSGLTKTVLCSATFRTSSVRNVPDSEKHEDETEYGLAAKGYGATLEIDHIVPLELGGSNDIANLFPERAAPAPGYHVKDKLENKLHDLVCAGLMTLHAAQVGIAANWRGLYSAVFDVAP
jgi:hypothetical protein